MNKTKQKVDLLRKYLALAATDIILTLIEEQELTKDDTQDFMQHFFSESQMKLKSDARIEEIALWLVEHGYASITDEFSKRLDEFIEKDLKSEIDSPDELALILDNFYAEN